MRLIGQFDHSNYPLKRNEQFASQNCPFKQTLAELFDPNQFYQPVRLTTLYCSRLRVVHQVTPSEQLGVH